MAPVFSGEADSSGDSVGPLCGVPRQEPRAQQLLRKGILKKPKGKGILKKPEGKAKSEWGKELAFLLFGASCHQRLMCV